MNAKKEVLRLLDAQGISYKLAEHKAVYTIDEILALGLPDVDSVAKNLFIRDDKKRQYFLLTLKKEKRLDLKQFQTKRGTRRLSFASEKDLNDILGLTKGALTPLGVLNDRRHRVTVLLDADFIDRNIGIHPNDNTATVWLPAKELFSLIQKLGNEVEWMKF